MWFFLKHPYSAAYNKLQQHTIYTHPYNCNRINKNENKQINVKNGSYKKQTIIHTCYKKQQQGKRKIYGQIGHVKMA